MTDDVTTTAARESDRSYLAPEILRQRMRTLELLAPQAGETALDAGCGVGLLSEPLALELGPTGRLIGVDLTAEVLEKARARCAPFGNARFLEGGVEALPLESATVDLAACTQVLLYVPDVPKALRELHRVLKPGGRLVVVETDWAGLVLNAANAALTQKIVAGWDAAVPSPRLPRTLKPMLEEAGFAAVRAEALPILRTSMTADDFAYATLDWFARLAPEHAGVASDEARAWLDDLLALQDRGRFFFCVNRFLFSGVRV